MTFKERVKNIVKSIPKGKTMTYKEVALKAGNGRAGRAVGMILSRNFDSTIPCHRVVRKDGTLGGFNRGGTENKRALLVREGTLR